MTAQSPNAPLRTLIVGDPVVALGRETLIPDGALIVEGSTIVAAGARAELQEQGPFDRVLGSTGHFVMPGFVNCHYHSELAIGPGLYQFVFERANVFVHAAMARIDEEDLYVGVLWGLINALKGGQSSTVDMYYGRPGMFEFGCSPALRAYEDIGMRTAFGLVSRDENIYVHESNERFLERLPPDLAGEVRGSPMGYAWPVGDVMASFERLSDEWHGRDDRIRIVTAPDWTPACSDALYQRCRRAADERETQMISHVLETRSEMLYNVRRYGKPALRRLADLGVLNPRTVLEHFVWVTDEELGIFADSGAVASNDPGSNLRLSSGICRVRDIMDSGGRIAFGTDGISFSDHEDFFQELRLACYLQRMPDTFERQRLESEAVLRSASSNGARALGMEDRLGSLEPGRYADLLILDKERILFPPGRYDAEPFLDVVLDRTESRDIDTVMVHGRTVVEGGRVTAVDEDAVKDRFAEAVQRIYRPSEDVVRSAELGRLVEPYVIDFYRPWYRTPIEPASIYNAKRPPVADAIDAP